MVIERADNGPATYTLLIDDVVQKLSWNRAHWDDASPWAPGVYGASYSPLHQTYPAFLIEFPANRSEIKFHRGNVTGHSEGCIVTEQPHVDEIIAALNARHLPLNKLKFDVRGDFGIGYQLALAGKPDPVPPGGTISLKLGLTGTGAPNGVSKDIWFYIVADNLKFNQDYVVQPPEPLPVHRTERSYPMPPAGFWVKLAANQQQRTIELVMKPAHATAGTKMSTFSIKMYKILNSAGNRTPYFYTPSNYAIVLAAGTTTAPQAIAATTAPAAAPRPAGARPQPARQPHPAHAFRR